jgi:hypothetical protein
MAPVAIAKVIPMGKRASRDPEKMRLAKEAARRTSIAPQRQALWIEIVTEEGA